MIRMLWLTALLLAVFFTAMRFYTNAITERTNEAQKEILQSAVENAMRTCYAIEGKYPDSIDYLIENYSLRYNEERFHIYFDAFATNVMPDVRIIDRGR